MTFGPDRLSTSFRDLLRPFGEGFYGVDIKQTDGRFAVSDGEDEIRSALTRTTGRARRAGARYPSAILPRLGDGYRAPQSGARDTQSTKPTARSRVPRF